MQHPRRRADGWHPPYQLALEHLLAAGVSEAGRDSAPSAPGSPQLSPVWRRSIGSQAQRDPAPMLDVVSVQTAE